MKLLFFYWGMILLGYFIGSKCRNMSEKLNVISTLLFITVIALVFVMGTRMGSNKEVISNLHTIGLDALLITLFIMGGSVISVTITRRFLKLQRNGLPVSCISESPREISQDNDTDKKNRGTDKMSSPIMVSIVFGLTFGYLFIDKFFTDYVLFEHITGNIMVMGISFLLFLVGIDLGLAGTIATSLKNAGIKVFIFPIAVVMGTLAGAFLCGLILPISQKEALAIGAGFGWYTLAPILVSEQGYVIAGAISFIHNVMREFGGIVLIPFVAKKFGCIEASSLPGVAAMDISLPLVEQICGEQIVIYSFLIGLLQSALVPLLVPILIGL